MGNLTSLKKNKYKSLEKYIEYSNNISYNNDNNINKTSYNTNVTNNISKISYDLIQFSESEDSDSIKSDKQYTNVDLYNNSETHIRNYTESSKLLDNYNDSDNENHNIFDDIYSIDNLQKICILNLQFISLWLNTYDRNINKYNISNILIYDFNAHFLQNKQIPFPSNKYLNFTIISNHNINNFLISLAIFYYNQYKLNTKLTNQSTIKDFIIFVQELIMIFLDKKEIKLCTIGNVNLSRVKIITYYENKIYKKHYVYDVYNDGIFSSNNNLIENTQIKTIFNTSMRLTDIFKLNTGYIPVPSKNIQIISISLSLFYRLMLIYGVMQ